MMDLAKEFDEIKKPIKDIISHGNRLYILTDPIDISPSGSVIFDEQKLKSFIDKHFVSKKQLAEEIEKIETAEEGGDLIVITKEDLKDIFLKDETIRQNGLKLSK